MNTSITYIIGKILPKSTAESEKFKMMLEMQKCPVEVQRYLTLISSESKENGWQWVVVKACCLGIIIGKRIERDKQTQG